MSKYGSGVSMSDTITAETQHVEEILDRNGVGGEDKEAVLDALKEMAFQWCNANAFSCAMETALKKLCPDISSQDFMQAILENGVINQKMAETFPFNGLDA